MYKRLAESFNSIVKPSSTSSDQQYRFSSVRVSPTSSDKQCWLTVSSVSIGLTVWVDHTLRNLLIESIGPSVVLGRIAQYHRFDSICSQYR